MKRKYIMALIIIIAAAQLGGCARRDSDTPELLVPVAANRDTAYAEIRDIQQVRLIEAVIYPPAEGLTFNGAGVIGSFAAALGDSVKAGDILVSLDTSLLESRKEWLSEELAYKRAIHDIRNEQAEMTLAVLSGANYRLSLNEMEQAEALRTEEIELLEVQLAECLQQLENAELAAPWDGSVLRINVAEGGYVNEKIPALYLTRDNEAYMSSAYMSESEYNNLISCTAIVDGNRYEVEYLPYERTEYLSMTARGMTVNSRFRVMCDDPQKLFGRNAMLELVTESRESVLALPAGTIQRDSDGYFVYKVSEDRQIKTYVEIAAVTDAWTEIKSGLQEGDEVYVAS